MRVDRPARMGLASQGPVRGTWALVALLAGACGAWGCGGDPAGAPLLKLSGVARDRVEPGTTLRFLGDGFPVGQAGQVRLVGTTARPGKAPVSVDAVLPVRAISAEVLVSQVDAAALFALGGYGTFDGSARVRFTAQEASIAVVGELPGLRLDLRPPLQAELPATRARRARALAMLTFLGATPEAESETTAGIPLADAREGSIAAQAGLAPGDLVTEAGGVRVRDLGDLAPPPLSQTAHFMVRRGGQGQALPVMLSLQGFEAPALSEGLSMLCAALVLCIVVGVWFGPLPGPTPLLARLRSRLSVGMPLFSGAAWLDGSGDTPAARRLRTGQRWALSASATALLLSVGALEPLGGGPWGALPAFVVLLCLQLMLTMLTSGGGPRAGEDRAAHLAQLRNAAVVMLTLGLACIAASERSLVGLVASQGALPWHFGAFQTPALLLLLGPFLIHGSRLSPLARPASRDRQRPLGQGARAAAFALSALTRMLLVAVATAVFWGGWSVAGLGVSDPLNVTALGALLFAVKGWGMALLLHGARLVRLGAASPRWQTPCLCALACAATLAFRWLDPGPQAALAVGATSFAATAILLSVSVWRLSRSSSPMAPLGTPFATADTPSR